MSSGSTTSFWPIWILTICRGGVAERRGGVADDSEARLPREARPADLGPFVAGEPSMSSEGFPKTCVGGFAGLNVDFRYSTSGASYLLRCTSVSIATLACLLLMMIATPHIITNDAVPPSTAPRSTALSPEGSCGSSLFSMASGGSRQPGPPSAELAVSRAMTGVWPSISA